MSGFVILLHQGAESWGQASPKVAISWSKHSSSSWTKCYHRESAPQLRGQVSSPPKYHTSSEDSICIPQIQVGSIQNFRWVADSLPWGVFKFVFHPTSFIVGLMSRPTSRFFVDRVSCIFKSQLSKPQVDIPPSCLCQFPLQVSCVCPFVNSSSQHACR